MKEWNKLPKFRQVLPNIATLGTKKKVLSTEDEVSLLTKESSGCVLWVQWSHQTELQGNITQEAGLNWPDHVIEREKVC
jgi:hypothetical protein